jgi:glutathione synthase/RimK-type ligase-like ATP-grasp enzyme
MKPLITFFTDLEHEHLSRSDLILCEALQKSGYEVTVTSWEVDLLDPSRACIGIVRSTWNYPRKYNDFITWIKTFGQQRVLYNSPELVIWNSNKKYLLDLKRKGVAIVDSVILPEKTFVDFAYYKALFNAEMIVAKPTIGTSGAGVTVAVHDFYTEHETVLQPYLSGFKEGEVSLMYFGGKYSFSAIRKPSQNDFRVNLALGGSSAMYEPDPELLTLGDACIRTLEADTLYARVDCVRQGSVWYVNELELIEPVLFFDVNPGKADDFVRCFSERNVRGSV